MGRKVKFVLCFPHLPERHKPYHRFTKLNRKYFTMVNPETKQVEPAYDRFQFSQGDLMIPTKVTVTFSEEEHSVTVSVAASERDVPGCAASDDIRLVVRVVKEEYVLVYPLELGKEGMEAWQRRSWIQLGKKKMFTCSHMRLTLTSRTLRR